MQILLLKSKFAILLFTGLRIQLSSYSPDDKCCHVNFCSCLLVSLQYCYACKSYNTPTPTTVTTEFPHSELESKISNKNIFKLFAQDITRSSDLFSNLFSLILQFIFSNFFIILLFYSIFFEARSKEFYKWCCWLIWQFALLFWSSKKKRKENGENKLENWRKWIREKIPWMSY